MGRQIDRYLPNYLIFGPFMCYEGVRFPAAFEGYEGSGYDIPRYAPLKRICACSNFRSIIRFISALSLSSFCKAVLSYVLHTALELFAGIKLLA